MICEIAFMLSCSVSLLDTGVSDQWYDKAVRGDDGGFIVQPSRWAITDLKPAEYTAVVITDGTGKVYRLELLKSTGAMITMNNKDGKLVVKVMDDGNVVFGPAYRGADKFSRDFWTQLAKTRPCEDDFKAWAPRDDGMCWMDDKPKDGRE